MEETWGNCTCNTWGKSVLKCKLLGKTPKIVYDELVQAHGEEDMPSFRTIAQWMKDMREGTFTDEKSKPPGCPHSVRSTDLVERA